MTANRICITYWRNAERLPIGIPESMRSPPNQTIATVERFMIPKRNGIIIAKR